MNIKNVLALVAIVAIGGGSYFVLAQSDAPEAPIGAETGEGIVTVYKSEFCGCCGGWVDHLRANGLEVNIVNVASTIETRDRLGVPHELGSCHTAKVGKYWVEGHVPADLVQQLVSEQPDDIRGIAAPGMPLGSPGMEGPNPVTFNIVAHYADGTNSVYATRKGKTAVEKEAD